MNARRSPPKHREAVRLLAIDPAKDLFADARAEDLPLLLEPGDLLVVNDAATLPASLFGSTERGEPIEVRLCGHGDAPARFRAVLFGAGDWRTRTEDRAAPPPLEVGARLDFAAQRIEPVEGASNEARALDGRKPRRAGRSAERSEDSAALGAIVRAVSPVSPRLLELELDREGAQLWEALYAIGRPVQYSHLADDLELDAVQTSYGGRPFAFEMPSAGRPLSFAILSRLRARGVRIARLLHAAGLSATGDPSLDAALPLPERYEIPQETVAAIEEAHANGRRVIAVGTTVVRALEGCHREHGRLIAGAGVTDLVIDASFVPRVVDGLVSGLHDPTESHYRLLRAFADDALLARAIAHAERQGYHNHELGDLMLVS
jgi:S-adenosylmethionine:tRNA ribosyltransferase-isomerase